MTVHWRKSSYSGSANDEMCVELADLADGIGIRDSKDPEGRRLTVRESAFAELIYSIKDGVHDQP